MAHGIIQAISGGSTGCAGGDSPLMAGNDFSPHSTPCCPTATIVDVVVNGIFTGGPL